jgi:hypothetical protein
VRRGVDLVYGGGSIGLMGLIARTVLDGGRRVVGYVRTQPASFLRLRAISSLLLLPCFRGCTCGCL